jgi:hypothetical protein
MSGKLRRIRIGGRSATVPEDRLADLLVDLENDGVDYDVDPDDGPALTASASKPAVVAERVEASGDGLSAQKTAAPQTDKLTGLTNEDFEQKPRPEPDTVEGDRQRRITDLMRSDGKSASSVIAEHPELARGSFTGRTPASGTDGPAGDAPRPWFAALADQAREMGREDLRTVRNLYRDTKETLGDAYTAATAGATYGTDDDIVRAVAGDAAGDEAQRRKHEAFKRSPVASVVSDVAGGFANPLGGIARGAGPLAEAIVSGAARAFGDSNGSAAERGTAAAGGALTGSLYGMVPGISKGAANAYSALARGAGGVADRMRLTTWLPRSQVKTLAREKGDDAVAAYARELEAPRQGLDGDSIAGGYFTTAEGGERRAQKVAAEAAKRANAVEGELASRYPVASLKDGAAGPDVDVSQMVNDLRGQGRVVAGRAAPIAERHADYLNRTADRIEGTSLEPIPGAADGANVYGGSAFGSPQAYAAPVGVAGEQAALQAAGSALPQPGRPYRGTFQGGSYASQDPAVPSDIAAAAKAQGARLRGGPAGAFNSPPTLDELSQQGFTSLEVPHAGPTSQRPGQLVYDLAGDTVTPVGRPAAADVTLAPDGRAMFAEQPTGNVPFSRALADRRYYDRSIGQQWTRPAGTLGPEDLVDRGVANDYRGALTGSIEANAPDLAQPWQSSMRDQHVANLVLDPVSRSASAQYGVNPFSVRDAISALSGRGIGMVNTAGRVAAPIAAPAAATAMRDTSRALGAAADASRFVGNASQFAMPGIAQQAAASRRGEGVPDDAYSQQQSGEESRGYNVQANMARVMKESPQLFAPFKNDFDRALESGNESDFVAVAERLAREDSPKGRLFARTVWPRLTGAQQQ